MNYKKISNYFKNYFCRTNRRDGFTIIELIVVIAIIAILAAIVGVSISKYITSSKNSAIFGDIHSMISDAAIYNSNTGSYSGLCGDTVISGFANALAGAVKQSPNNSWSFCSVSPDGTKWIASALLNDRAGFHSNPSSWCIDSTGYTTTMEYSCDSSTTFTCPHSFSSTCQ